MKKLNKKGFTIVELVIVIAVIAILAAVLIPTFSGVVDKANSSSALQTARSTLTNTLNMSKTASLAGTTKDGVEKTVIVVNGYAFKYTGNELQAYDYPNGKATAKLKNGSDANTSNYNAIIIAAENLVEINDDVNYTETTVEPADWNDNWKNYYIKGATYAAVTADSAPAWESSTYYAKNTNVVYDIKNVADVICGEEEVCVTNIAAGAKVTLVGDTYYLNYSKPADTAVYDAVVYINSDFSNKVVVFTTFAN